MFKNSGEEKRNAVSTIEYHPNLKSTDLKLDDHVLGYDIESQIRRKQPHAHTYADVDIRDCMQSVSLFVK